jgi:hypothetical protein
MTRHDLAVRMFQIFDQNAGSAIDGMLAALRVAEAELCSTPDALKAHPLDGLLEPGARNYDAVVSIAISLKRLADHLAPTDGKQPPLLWLGDMIRAPQS